MNTLLHIYGSEFVLISLLTYLNRSHLIININFLIFYDKFIIQEDRAGHDKRYAIDATKLETELSWKADENFETGIVKTVEWYLS